MIGIKIELQRRVREQESVAVARSESGSCGQVVGELSTLLPSTHFI